jgi:hypothetical protein
MPQAGSVPGKSSFIGQKKQASWRDLLSVNFVEKYVREGESSHEKGENVQDFSAIAAD